METKQNKASCISCRHYDFETHICTHGSGLLREIDMSDSLAVAEHGCKEYAGVEFRFTPAGLLKMTLEEFNVEVPDHKVIPICDKFIKYLIEDGYITIDETDD